MKKLKITFITTIIMFSIIVILTNQNVFANDQEYLFQNIEYTEEFKKWLELPEEEKKKVIQPRMYDIPIAKYTPNNLLFSSNMVKASIQNRFSLKDIIPENLEIRNQQQTGACWAFARLSSLETNLALTNYKNDTNTSKVYDFSERHIEYSTSRWFANDVENPIGYNRNVGDGGNHYFVDSYLANGTGAIPEEEMPFENNENIIDINEIQNKTVSTELYDTIEFPNYNQTPENKVEIMNQIKEHIQNYGSVYASLHGDNSVESGSDCYNADTAAKFCSNEEEHIVNHAVSIIGWDDNYSVDNFSKDSKPTANGAWIVRNSWGEKNEVTKELKQAIFDVLTDQCIEEGWNSAEEIPNENAVSIATQLGIKGLIIEGNIIYQKYGDNGLIYVSYEDVNITKELTGIVKATDTIGYDNIYGYNELGQNILMSFKGSNMMLCNIFDKKSDKTEYLTQVSIYAPDTYTCKVYVNPNGTSNSKNDLQLVALKQGESETFNSGYHTLEFAKPIAINSKSYAVVIEIQSKTDELPFALEGKDAIQITEDAYSTAKIETGKCFVAMENNLENCEWYDLGKLSESGLGIMLPNGDSTIKAFTTNELLDGSLKSIEITTPPNKTKYFEGENFDKTGMVVTANYNSKTKPSAILDDSSYSITNGTNLKEGQTSVTITYEDKSVEQPITVEKNSVTELKIKTPPNKVEYKEGESFDKTGMVIEATYKDGSKKEIQDYEIKDGNNLKGNQTKVIISYGDIQVEQEITVTPNPLIEIKITKAPNKTKYIIGEDFDKTGMVVIGTYEDGSNYEIIDYTIQNGTNLSKDQTYVTIEYDGKTVNQEITVEEKYIVEISINQMPSKLTYIQYKEELDLTGGSILVKYNNGTNETIDMSNEKIEITGFDNTKLGKITLTVNYLSKTTQFEVEIIEEQKAQNSKLDNANCNVKGAKVYYFTDNSQESYMLIDIEINNIERNLTNDKVEYYYYLSPNQNEENIEKWTQIEDYGNYNDKLQFTIDSRDIKNYNEFAGANKIYLYIKEVAIKGGDQSIKISKPMELGTTTNMEVYINNVKQENFQSGNENKDSSNDNTIATGKLPHAGIKITIIAFIIITLVIGIVIYIRYKNISKYVK